MDSTIYFDVLVLVEILLGNVFCDHIRPSRCLNCNRNSLAPTGSSPKLLLQVPELSPQRCAGRLFSLCNKPPIVICCGNGIDRCMNTVCAPRRYFAIPKVYPARTR